MYPAILADASETKWVLFYFLLVVYFGPPPMGIERMSVVITDKQAR